MPTHMFAASTGVSHFVAAWKGEQKNSIARKYPDIILRNLELDLWKHVKQRNKHGKSSCEFRRGP